MRQNKLQLNASDKQNSEKNKPCTRVYSVGFNLYRFKKKKR